MNPQNLACPTCGAPLQLGANESLAHCGFCHTKVAITPPDPVVDPHGLAIAELNSWLDSAISPFGQRDANGFITPPPTTSRLGTVLMICGGLLGMGWFFAGSVLFNPLIGMAGLVAMVLLVAGPGATMTSRAEKRSRGFKEIEAEYFRRRETLERRFSR